VNHAIDVRDQAFHGFGAGLGAVMVADASATPFEVEHEILVDQRGIVAIEELWIRLRTVSVLLLILFSWEWWRSSAIEQLPAGNPAGGDDDASWSL
jgi:hypothetical protein